MNVLIAVCLALAVAAPAWSQSQAQAVPLGWYKSGSRSQDYVVGTDETVKRGGAASAFVKSRIPEAAEFGTLMQTIRAEPWRGKRIRLAAYLKTASVAKSAVIWMRIDGRDRTAMPLGFDNMTNRELRGTVDWTRVEIVLDVPPEAMEINFGIMLSGAGQVWADDLQFEEVSTKVPTTGGPPRFPNAPVNLNFERRPGT